MKPLKLHLQNVGPFMDETIDFTQLHNNELFLISGKTGSGKSMLFDAIVFALYGKASTASRKEGALRSHFADGKSPMEVELIFQLKDKQFKVIRQGAFVKEGNKNQTNPNLAVYELENGSYALRESKVNDGNNYIQELLGVNIEQFRQLFILPQGEFKKFLFSRSSSKQEILRTLFNTNRFEALQQRLVNQNKEEKKKIEMRHQQIEQLWNKVEDFGNEKLQEYKTLPSIQTEKILNTIPEFERIGNEIYQQLENEKIQQDKLKQKAEKSYREAEELSQKITEQNDLTTQLETLEKQASEIKILEAQLKKIREVRPLHQIIENISTQTTKLNELNDKFEKIEANIQQYQSQLQTITTQQEKLAKTQNDIESQRMFVNETQYFYQNHQQYQNAYRNQAQVQEEYEQSQQDLKQNEQLLKDIEADYQNEQPDYERLNQLTQQIFGLKQQIKDTEASIEKEEAQAQRLTKLKTLEQELTDNTQKLNELQAKISQFNTNQLELDNQETMIKKLQSMLQPGDQCPICGNTIQSLSDHLDFEELRAQREILNTLHENKEEIRTAHSKLEAEYNVLKSETEKFEQQELPENNTQTLQDLKKQYEKAETDKQHQDKRNKEIEKTNAQVQQIKDDIQNLQLTLTQKKADTEKINRLIEDFEKGTSFRNVTDFMNDFEKKQDAVTDYQKQTDALKQQEIEMKQQIAVEQTKHTSVQDNRKEIDKAIAQLKQQSQIEMENIGIQSSDEVQEILDLMPKKAQIEERIKKYHDKENNLSHKLAELKAIIGNQESPDLEQLSNNLETQKSVLEEKSKRLNEHDFKLQLNASHFTEIQEHIDVLAKELAEQQEIFDLAEVLSGKNIQKLTLENYVLVYYLEMILEYANKRFMRMTNNRYILKRSEEVTQGYSGLEIVVFDSHSNKTRHISTLSGGESFQASLALALGLSEVVQQESGGITLESMFIDEGFGTLDQETLETALDTLLNIKSTGRMVGIISHVSELKQRIPTILEVKTDAYQSTTQFKF
ncbi:exonuclease subunit SbcC [Staphylococcus debuckii]|uniref:exonuclease subunit SbcC n=1 Tax=Staphylococcus debuckii TaxID=2044912 RepID=UPI000F4388F1|nr:exonuclease subunit SbcC [Staphylococcus debuckii]AYU55160.1 SMC family ATPase [Staphylococcus debuckii]